MVLLSDLLLITKVEDDHYITVLEEPIVLQDIANIQWNCQYGQWGSKMYKYSAALFIWLCSCPDKRYSDK